MTDDASASASGPLTPEWWSGISPLLDEALDLAPRERAAYLAALAHRNAPLAAELARLVEECGRADPLFDRPAAERFPQLFEVGDADAMDDRLRAALQASLGSRFVLERELDGGGMSRVFVADEPELGRKVVIKVVAPERLVPRSAARFEREMRVAASLQQANIVPLLWAGSAEGFSYYAMPFVDGLSLRERIARDGVLPIGEGVSVLRDVARALAHAHEHGVVHRDIKPGNVLLSGDTAMVTDFGIAKALGSVTASDASHPVTSDVALGTPGYMAPEQASGDPDVDHRADIYAFGCLAYAIFTGHPPFHDGRPHEVVAAHFTSVPRPLAEGRPDVPSGMAALVARCLEKDPARRPQRASELLALLDGTQVVAPTPAPRRRARAAIGVALAVGLAILATAAYARSRGQPARVAAAQASEGASPAARALYDTGQRLLRRRGPGVAGSVGYFERAIAIDSRFARAHAALASALALVPYFVGTPPAELRDRTANAARRALELDSTLVDAHTALGTVSAHDGRWADARAEYEHALALSPHDVGAHLHYGRMLVNLGRQDEAMTHFQAAHRQEPVSSVLSGWIAYTYFLEGKTDSALAESARAVALDSSMQVTTNLSALLNLGLGRADVARRVVPLGPRVGMMSNAPYVLAKLGDASRAGGLLRAMESNTPQPWFLDVARATVSLGTRDTARALDALERSAETSGTMWIVYLPVRDPAYDPLRGSARFAALVRGAGLDSSFLLPNGGRGGG